MTMIGISMPHNPHGSLRKRVNFALVAKNQNDLNIYLAYVSKVSPRSHPDLFPSPRLLDE